MPELPEVETVARGLQSALPGRRILSIRLGKTDFIEDPAALEEIVPGTRILAVRRYGKFLVLDLEPSGGAGAPLCMLVHLGMTGQLTARRADEPAAPHTHVFFALDDGRELRYTDIRRFGRVLVVPESKRESALGQLGLDPLEVGEDEFRRRLGGRRARVKALLLDQRVLRGLGNIYTDESLWRARIHPMRLAAALKTSEAAGLYRAIREVLTAAIRLRGSSISDYVDAAGLPGEYQRRHRVYQREGKKCFRCSATIRRAIVAGRSSYFCPRCQPAPRRRTSRRSNSSASGKSSPRRPG
jgi:formamidopyrimidine-DNA glycosylase